MIQCYKSQEDLTKMEKTKHNHNPEIKKVLKEIEKWTYPIKDSSKLAGNTPSRVEGVYDYMKDLAKATLKGILIAQENELRFLLDMRTQLDSPDFDDTDVGITKQDIDKRIQQLKQSNKDIEEKLK